MKRHLPLAVLVPLLVGAPSLPAQDVTLPEYTMEQRWNRLATLMVGWEAAVVALGESHGMGPGEVGTWIGEFFSQDWLGGAEAVQLLRGMNRNFTAMPDATVEVLASTPTSVTARFNRPIDARLGAGGRVVSVPGESILRMLTALESTIAEWVGVDLERRVDGDHDVLTLRTRYGPIQASDGIRWARGAYLSWIARLQLLSLRKESGLTATQIGEADAELYAPSWTAQTPWQLFRGMVWNQMTDPNTDCEVLSASPTEVRARCREHYRELVTANQSRFNVTSEDVFESGRAFAMGVADHLGLRWVESLEGGYRMITVTK